MSCLLIDVLLVWAERGSMLPVFHMGDNKKPGTLPHVTAVETDSAGGRQKLGCRARVAHGNEAPRVFVVAAAR